MNFVEVGPTNPISIFMILVSAALAVGGLIIGLKGERAWTVGLAVVMFIAGLLGFALGMASLSGTPLYAQQVKVGDQIEKAYGLELSRDELEDLDYPTEKPDTDFEVFGSFSIDEPEDDGFLRTEVFLIWRDGEMALAGSPDGETFTELQR